MTFLPVVALLQWFGLCAGQPAEKPRDSIAEGTLALKLRVEPCISRLLYVQRGPRRSFADRIGLFSASLMRSKQERPARSPSSASQHATAGEFP